MPRRRDRLHDLSIRWKLLGACCLVLLLVGAQSAFVYRSTVENRKADAWVEHTLRVIDLIGGVTNGLVVMQTDERGFLLTGDEQSLARYLSGQATYAADVQTLRTETSDNPSQQARWDDLERRVAEWQQEAADPGIALRRQVNAGTADAGQLQAFAQSAGGEARFDAIRQELAAGDAAEHTLLAARERRADAARTQLRRVVLIGTAIIALLAVALALLGSRALANGWTRMALVAERVAAGDLSQRIGLSRKDEVGRTAAAFDGMVGRVQTLVRELETSIGHARRSEARTRAVLDVAQAGMVLVSTDGRVLSFNQPFRDLFGATADVIGREVTDLRDDLMRIFADSAVVDRLLASVQNADRRLSETVRQAYPVERELALTSAPVAGECDKEAGRVFAFRDVTAEREADRTKSEFISLVSHELRTPLTSIKGYVDLIVDGEAGDLDPLQSEFLGIVQHNVDRLVGLIDELLDIARIEAGKVELAVAPVELARLVRGVTLSFRPQFEAKQQTLTVDLPAALPLVMADPDRLTQILANLVSNAHKYTPAGGSATIRAREEAGTVRIAVSDTGIGMSPQELAKLFTKFFRSSNRAAREVGGTGLGLVITRSLVELLGGELAVISTPGGGSEFSFRLAVAAAGTDVGPRGRVLVIGDEMGIASLLRPDLEQMGYEVITAPADADGVRAARGSRPDLIMLDLERADANGFALLDALRRDPATADLPILVVSAWADDGEWRRRGAAAVFAQPVPERALLDRVEALIVARGERSESGLVEAANVAGR
jgi:PAS domain S-box-containing protein